MEERPPYHPHWYGWDKKERARGRHDDHYHRCRAPPSPRPPRLPSVVHGAGVRRGRSVVFSSSTAPRPLPTPRASFPTPPPPRPPFAAAAPPPRRRSHLLDTFLLLFLLPPPPPRPGRLPRRPRPPRPPPSPLRSTPARGDSSNGRRSACLCSPHAASLWTERSRYYPDDAGDADDGAVGEKKTRLPPLLPTASRHGYRRKGTAWTTSAMPRPRTKNHHHKKTTKSRKTHKTSYTTRKRRTKKIWGFVG